VQLISYDEARRRALEYLRCQETARREERLLRIEGLSSREREALGPEDYPFDESDDSLALQEDGTIEEKFGWVFFYNTKKYVETGDVRYCLFGNAPIIVSQPNGKIYVTGTAYPVEHYIENFKRFGDPHREE